MSSRQYVWKALVVISALTVSSCVNPLRDTIEDIVAATEQIAREGVIYVSALSGEDANPGLPQSPKKTINAAIDFLADNDLTADVRVAEGTYTLPDGESIVVPEGISLYGGYRDGTWVRDFESYPTVVEKDPDTGAAVSLRFEAGVTRDTVVDGFVLNSGPALTVIVVAILDASPTLSNCTIDGTGAIDESTGIAIDNGDPHISYNLVYGGAGSVASDGIRITGGSEPIVLRNAIAAGTRSNTVANGVQVVNSSPLIQGNYVIYASGDGGSRTVGMRLRGGTPQVYGNTIEGGGGSDWSIGVVVSDGAAARIVSNAIHGGWSTGSTGSRGVESSSSASLVIRNNTISAGTNDTDSIAIADFSGGAIIDSNILFSQAPGGERRGIYLDDAASTPAAVRNNAFFDLASYLVYQDGTGGYLASSDIEEMESYLQGEGATASDNVSSTNHLVDTTDEAHLSDGWSLSATAPPSLTQGGYPASAEPFTYDRLDVPRTDPWSIGAYEID